MSDFDKEAERKKLREKYERDKEKRRQTQRMSELLLKGATMTNRHCEECGDPIFRYDGQEFCPTCQAAQQSAGPDAPASEAAGTGAAENEATGVGAAESEPAGAGAAGQETEAESELENGVEIDVDDTASAAAETRDGTAAESAPESGGDVSPAEGEPSVAAVDAGGTGTAEASTGKVDISNTDAVDANSGSVDASTGTVDPGREREGDLAGHEREGDLTGARSSLTRSIERYARAAEQVEDPRRARDYLAAAREAAEALRALDR